MVLELVKVGLAEIDESLIGHNLVDIVGKNFGQTVGSIGQMLPLQRMSGSEVESLEGSSGG